MIVKAIEINMTPLSHIKISLDASIDDIEEQLKYCNDITIQDISFGSNAELFESILLRLNDNMIVKLNKQKSSVDNTPVIKRINNGRVCIWFKNKRISHIELFGRAFRDEDRNNYYIYINEKKKNLYQQIIEWSMMCEGSDDAIQLGNVNMLKSQNSIALFVRKQLQPFQDFGDNYEN